MDCAFNENCKLTDDVGASVIVHSRSHGLVWLHMGGDLSVSVCMTAEGARELSRSLSSAADALSKEPKP